MTHKETAKDIYQEMFNTTPDTLSWGTRHNIALAAAKKSVHRICLALPAYPCDNVKASTSREVIDCAIESWKKVKEELNNL